MDWTRGHTIGRGSSAAVSLGTSRWSSDLFAVKSVELSQSEFLQREQKILSSLSCPHIVSYRGCDITEENNKLMYNLFMEYASGGTLSDAIRKQGGRLDESMIGFYTQQIVQGLEYLHSNGLVHCDIKGRNILIGDGGAKIGDLGCAKWVEPAARTNEPAVEAVPIAGTPLFMAPEVAAGEEQGLPADVWALGCTMIEMATGGSPWPNVTDPLSVLYRIAHSEDLPEFPNFLSEQAKDFLSKCLRRDPIERWTAAQLLKHPFLGEFNSHPKQNQESNSSSPTSILDQDFWNTMEESQSQGNLIQSSPGNSPAERIMRLLSPSSVPNWVWDENWITIRSNNNGDGEVNMVDFEAEAKMICGSVADSIIHDREGVESPAVSECLLNVSEGIASSGVGRGVLMACRCRKDSVDSVVSSNLNFLRDKDDLLLLTSISRFL
ncbi:hypothetical protein L1049_025091 [Liquidambar formosana]|uniref:mitogen-activated protein kinase kinase kinase n=1 Tax=Liquidambar formosana TaxID=63359 RepID=A0AAP0S306_LIQFO